MGGGAGRAAGRVGAKGADKGAWSHRGPGRRGHSPSTAAGADGLSGLPPLRAPPPGTAVTRWPPWTPKAMQVRPPPGTPRFGGAGGCTQPGTLCQASSPSPPRPGPAWGSGPHRDPGVCRVPPPTTTPAPVGGTHTHTLQCATAAPDPARHINTGRPPPPSSWCGSLAPAWVSPCETGACGGGGRSAGAVPGAWGLCRAQPTPSPLIPDPRHPPVAGTGKLRQRVGSPPSLRRGWHAAAAPLLYG